jgi:hypothetical protein
MWQDGVTHHRMKQHAVTVKFGRVLGPLLESAAQASGQSKNAIVRAAVERHLRRPRASGTFGEIAGRFAGCIRGTPKDLSSNPRYLERFGR